MSPAPIVLILGAGSRVGAGVACSFSAAGWSVALVSRSNPSPPAADPETGHLRIRADLAEPAEVREAFAAVKRAFDGRAPRVVVYNAATVSQPPDGGNLFSLPVERLEADVRVNSTGAWVAAGEAVAAWAEAGEEEGARFVFTGNILNTQPVPVPVLVTLGVSKSAAWYWVGAADLSFRGKGWRFFYADERKEDGSAIGNDLGAESHGKFYLHLAQGEWTSCRLLSRLSMESTASSEGGWHLRSIEACTASGARTGRRWFHT